MLFCYAIFFSAAYDSLDTGTGALILFGSVQITMIFVSFLRGESLGTWEWIGVLVAFSGFAMLMLPGAGAPALSGFVLMAVAGMAWGLYTLEGKNSVNALADSAANFLRATPLAVGSMLLWLLLAETQWSAQGILLACLSGGIASGVGYAIWYEVLPLLKSVQAAVVQLAVPFLAAAGGVLFSKEAVTEHLLMTAVIVNLGILLVVFGRAKSLKV